MSAELVLLVVATGCAGVAALFAILCFLRSKQLPDALTGQGVTQILRAETDIVRAAIGSRTARRHARHRAQLFEGTSEGRTVGPAVCLARA
jgi:hypothetical protein